MVYSKSNERDEKTMMNKKGFTLVEIMVVVAIIALLAAIATTNLLRTRLNANEGAAIGNMHTLVTVLGSFQAVQTPSSYPATLGILSAANPPYVDAVLAGGTKQGYIFTYVPGAIGSRGAIDAYTLTASPVTPGVTGNRVFFADQSGVIRLNDAAGAPIG